MENKRQNKFIAIPTRGGFSIVDQGQIVYCHAAGNYSNILLHDGSELVVTRKLKEVEEKLRSFYFVRIHHSYLVNLVYAKKYLKDYNGGLLVLQSGEKISVSQSKRKALMEKLTEL